MDPATTRTVGCKWPILSAESWDPIAPHHSFNQGTIVGYVRDPFGSCPASTTTFTAAACGLNNLPASRIDPTAIPLLNLYPQPTNSSPNNNFASSPKLYEHENTFDTRFDFNPTEKEQIFFRFSYSDDPQYIPGPFGGIADGGSFQQGIQTAKSDQAVAAWTHVFNPSTVNQVRGGFNHLHTTRFGPVGSQMGIPAKYGIQGIPQVAENGGLPAFGFGGLATLGSNNFLPSDEVSATIQVTDDFHEGLREAQLQDRPSNIRHVKFSTLQPGVVARPIRLQRLLYRCCGQERYKWHRAIRAAAGSCDRSQRD